MLRAAASDVPQLRLRRSRTGSRAGARPSPELQSHSSLVSIAIERRDGVYCAHETAGVGITGSGTDRSRRSAGRRQSARRRPARVGARAGAAPAGRAAGEAERVAARAARPAAGRAGRCACRSRSRARRPGAAQGLTVVPARRSARHGATTTIGGLSFRRGERPARQRRAGRADLTASAARRPPRNAHGNAARRASASACRSPPRRGRSVTGRAPDVRAWRSAPGSISMRRARQDRVRTCGLRWPVADEDRQPRRRDVARRTIRVSTASRRRCRGRT